MIKEKAEKINEIKFENNKTDSFLDRYKIY